MKKTKKIIFRQHDVEYRLDSFFLCIGVFQRNNGVDNYQTVFHVDYDKGNRFIFLPKKNTGGDVSPYSVSRIRVLCGCGISIEIVQFSGGVTGCFFRDGRRLIP